jgi:hypothetical protein
MRCYFHLVNGHETLRDDTGVDVPDKETARRVALNAIYELRQEGGQDDAGWSDWDLDIIDADGNLVLSLPLNMPLQ